MQWMMKLVHAMLKNWTKNSPPITHRIHVCYIYGNMDPINIPPLCKRIYTSTMDPDWDRHHHVEHLRWYEMPKCHWDELDEFEHVPPFCPHLLWDMWGFHRGCWRMTNSLKTMLVLNISQNLDIDRYTCNKAAFNRHDTPQLVSHLVSWNDNQPRGPANVL